MIKNNFNFFGFDKLNFVANNLLNILFNEATEIPLNYILEKICVSPPYFTFKKIYRYENILIAQVKAEQHPSNEITSISIGEAGRHMAILGTCACAIDQGNKNYYLVKNANISLINQNISHLCNKTDLYIAIESRYIDNKIANAYGILFNTEKKVIYQIESSYNKVKVDVFSKIFKNHSNHLNAIKESPYKKQIYFKNKNIKNNKVIVSFPEIKKENCAGHFKNYPILPTAFIIHNLICHIGNFLLKKYNKKRYYVINVSLYLKELMFVNSYKEAVIIFNNSNGLYQVSCKIMQDNKENSDIIFSICLI